MSDSASNDLPEATQRFDAALTRLEAALAGSVSKVADLARRTGFEDGRAQGIAEMADQQRDGPADLSPILRDELEAARARETQLQDAISLAKAALDDAMSDIRQALGPV